MSSRRTRPRFQPRVHEPEGRVVANARFRAEAARYGLRWQCTDCAYHRPSDGACSVGWPNEALSVRDADAIDERDEPVFCKAFEDATT
jgi:hypothetical protein